MAVVFRGLLAGVLALAVVGGGCAPVVVGGLGVAGGFVANDERTAGSIIEDQAIELKTNKKMDDFGEKANVSITSFNRVVLLTGQASTESIRKQIVAFVRGIDNVRSVHDKITISGASSLTARASDAILTTKVKGELCALQVKGFSCLPVKVVTESGVVYLLGVLTRENAALAVRTARGVKGVLKVVKVLQYRKADAAS